MIVLKEKDVVYLAENTAAELYNGYESEKDEELFENNQVWHIPNDDGIIACAARSGFEADIFRYDADFITGELTMEKLVLETVPKIKDVLRRFGKLDEDGDMEVQYAFAQKDKAFTISPSFCVAEIMDFTTFGRNDERGLAALHISKNLPPEERILFAQRMMFNFEMPRLAVIDTISLTPRVIQKRQMEKFYYREQITV